MPTLSDVLAFMDSKKRTVGRNLSDLVSNPKDYLTKTLYNAAETIPEYMNDPMNFVGGGLGKIAWHGSPHKFDKFRSEAIGTGEGAQAYGHGLYLAESPEVARAYAQNLDPMAQAARSGLDGEGVAARVLQSVDYDKAKAIKELISRKNAPHVQGNTEWAEKMDAAIAHIQGADKTSNLYKTDIPDEAVARFLDWDKPLSQQAPEVQAAIKGMRDEFPIGLDGWDIRPWMDADPLASTWHNEAMRNLGLKQDFFTKQLSSRGVPGIRYLDGGSRSTGQGSSNFVSFDPDMIRILERNGVPTGQMPWKPGEYIPLRDMVK